MDKLKRHAPCPFLNPSCGSSDAYSEYMDGGIKKGKCFSCGWHKSYGEVEGIEDKVSVTYVPFPYSSSDVEGIYKIYPLLSFALLDKYKVQLKSIINKNTNTPSRVIYLPCYLDGEYRGHQLKQLDSTPKYLSHVNDPLIYYTKLKTEHCETLVITEDWLSSIACSQIKHTEGLAIAGASFKANSELYKFIDKIRPDKIVIWLDDDETGRNGARKVDMLLSNLYLTRIVYNRKEPKECTVQELGNLINEQ